MKFTLIICTYMRPKPLLDLLNSVKTQTCYPDEILIVDGSTNLATSEVINSHSFRNLTYFLVTKENRGLTKQRNFGIQKTAKESEIICFLDDDTILENDYFQEVINAFQSDNEIVGVGGIAINENRWQKKIANTDYPKNKYYQFEDYVYPESSRNVFRNKLGLQSNQLPGRMPSFSHGRTCGFPLNGATYEVDLLIGLSFNFRRIVFENIKFSTYFEGYGLYEDADYCIRAQKFGKNVITTKAQLSHFHDSAGRPNKYNYGKMVVRNGWYVWRVKYPKPALNDKIKWHSITLLLTFIRFSNIFTTNKKQEAFTEFLGRTIGWFSLFVHKPK